MTAPNVIIIPHVHKRAAKRGIGIDEVRQTMLNPDQLLGARPNAKAGHERKKHLKDFGVRRLCVVVEYRGEARIAITTYWKRR